MLIAVKECKKSYKNWLNNHLSTSIHYGRVLNGSGNIYAGDIVAWQDCSKCNGRIFLISKKDILSDWARNSVTNHKQSYHQALDFCMKRVKKYETCKFPL